MTAQVSVAGTPLNALGSVSGVEWSTVWLYDGICGDKTAAWQWATGAKPSWLASGAPVVIRTSGRRRWTGRLNEPERTEAGWSCAAYGLRVLGDDLQSFIDTDPGLPVVYQPTTTPNAGIDAAIARGVLPWTRTESFGTTAIGTTDGTTLSVRDLILRAAKQAGQRAVVDQFGGLSLESDPTSPTWLLGNMSNYLGSADDELVTRLYGYYVSAVTGTPPVPSAWSVVTAADTNAETKFGVVVERTVDLTPLGLLTEMAAQAEINGRFALVGGRMGWTSGFAATRSWLSRMNGAPGDPAAIRAGDMIRLAGVRDFKTTTANRVAANIVIGEARYVADEDTCYMTPLGYVPRDFTSALAAAQAPEKVEAA